MSRNLLLIVLFLALVSCKKEQKTIQALDHTPPSSFTVKVTDREETYAIIQWTKSVSSDGSAITYSISLNGKTIAANLSDTTYNIPNLSDTLAYAGLVTATDKSGVMTRDTFTIHKGPGMVLTSTDNYLTCYTLGGDQRWSFSGSYTANPVRSNDTVFVEGDHISALSLQNGKPYWTYDLGYQGGGLVYYHGVLYTVLTDVGKMVAIDAHTGNLKWQIDANVADNSPAISNGMIYYISVTVYNSFQYTLNAIDASTGAMKWSKPMPGQTAIPSATNGMVFIQSASNESGSYAPGYLYAYDAAGTLKWTFGYTGGVGVNYQSKPVFIGNTVYFLAYQELYQGFNTLYALNVNDGSLKWKVDSFFGATSGTVFGGPDGVYVNTDDMATKYNLTSGRILWTVPYDTSLDGVGVDDIAVTPLGVYFRWHSGNSFYLQGYNVNDGQQTGNKIPDTGGYLFIIDGKTYYPYTSGMAN